MIGRQASTFGRLAEGSANVEALYVQETSPAMRCDARRGYLSAMTELDENGRDGKQ
jgi:hypothetical protein